MKQANKKHHNKVDVSKIPCSVGILTFNSEKTLKQALESVKNFDDIIICDGGSTDSTLSIAKEYRSRVIEQDVKYKDKDGRLKDFGGARNQTLAVAKHQWFFFIDSDEYIDERLKDEMTHIVSSGEPAAYWIPRLYVLRGDVIMCASTYPNKQMRFFHRSSSIHFIKEVHERILLKENTTVGVLKNFMYVPLPDSARELRKKWRQYIRIETERQNHLSLFGLAKLATKETAIAGLYALRVIKNYLFCRGKKMPLSFEMGRIWYQFYLIFAMIMKK